jgi:hypothetical protein
VDPCGTITEPTTRETSVVIYQLLHCLKPVLRRTGLLQFLMWRVELAVKEGQPRPKDAEFLEHQEPDPQPEPKPEPEPEPHPHRDPRVPRWWPKWRTNDNGNGNGGGD